MSNKWKNGFIRIIAYFILSKKKRRNFRERHLYITYKDNNQVLMILPNGREKKIKHKVKGLKVDFIGKNNTLKINKESECVNIHAVFQGDNSLAVIRNNTFCELASNCVYSMDETSYTCGLKIRLDEDNVKIIIGKNCAISWDNEFMAADYHTILNEQGKISNMPKPIEIKDYVWIGNGVKICKGVTIAENNIIGMGSVVTKSFLEHNCVIAGNPAKIVKRNIKWNVDRIKHYLPKHPDAK